MVADIANVHTDQGKGVPVHPYRRTAIVVGILLTVCTAASILSEAPLGSTLDRSVR